MTLPDPTTDAQAARWRDEWRGKPVGAFWRGFCARCNRHLVLRDAETAKRRGLLCYDCHEVRRLEERNGTGDFAP